MRAIITAAGFGSRMHALSEEPKCLLTISGETILGRQIRILRGLGVADITVVTGYKQDAILREYGERVSVRYNPHYEISGSIFSLWTARELLTEDVILLNSDVLFTEQPIQALIEDPNSYCLAVDRKECDREARKVKIENGLVTLVSKNISPGETFGEFIYVARVRREGLPGFRESLFTATKRDSHMGWPDAFNDLIKKNKSVHYTLVNSLWAEIDTPEDYDKAVNIFG